MILEHTTTDPEQVNAVFRRLRELDEGIDRKTSKHDRVQVLIAACIKEGIDTGKRIVGALKRLGYDGQHAGIILTKNTGTNPDLHWWRRDDEGAFHILEGSPADTAA